MERALLGGTGDIGEGLTIRFAIDTSHAIVVGSRDEEKARDRAREYESRLSDRGFDREIRGTDNVTAAADADVVVLAIPPHYVGDTIEQLAAENVLSEQILVSPAVGMQGDEDGLHYQPPSTGSVTELVAERAPDGVPVAGAFHTAGYTPLKNFGTTWCRISSRSYSRQYHNLAADRLADLDADLDVDTLVVADSRDVRQTVIDLTNELDGVRALSAGPLSNATEVESVTPLVSNVARYNEGERVRGNLYK